MKIQIFNKYLITAFCIVFFFSCENKKEEETLQKINWKNREIGENLPDTLTQGQTYLSVYSQIYSYTQHAQQDLTTTISLRNVSEKDSVYISKANYFNESGTLVRSYVSNTIFLAPMETLEIIIDNKDNEGGSGGNFMFNWISKANTPPPHFEAVMISTAGQQGLSFTTSGVRVK
ncbi:DUF3124 domain-containing protein [Galbibacter sp. BG1]|uniref:DUF3124 domain-containing protein n=1 Tax=Galbibacter sp. BG1 TaxID=1170699 RepID=UPI0015B98978|nr:DUF3124 domain-containing protein [Galbibacter sp. BG1]QLE00036.1 DUF3124 domain-containing protein [Galbibacter sp. BG1]